MLRICERIRTLWSRMHLARARRPDKTTAFSTAGSFQLLENHEWVRFVEECAALYDQLDGWAMEFDEPRRELTETVCLQLKDILVRSGVEVIDQSGPFDHNKHLPAKGTRIAIGTAVRIVSPGFAVGPRVFRRATVEIA